MLEVDANPREDNEDPSQYLLSDLDCCVNLV